MTSLGSYARPPRAVAWNTAGRLAWWVGRALGRAGLWCCGLSGRFEANADSAGYWQ